MKTSGNTLAQRDIEHVLHPTTDLYLHHHSGALIIERGEGIHVYDVDGKEYIEGMAGLWCAGFGFSEPELIKAATEQLQRLPFYHGFGNKAVVPTIELAEKLKSIVPFDASKVFFTNSGSEANDTQLRLYWYYNNAIGKPRKKKIISRLRGYHGVTVATSCLTGLPAFREGFDTPIDRVVHAQAPDLYRGMEAGESEASYSERLVSELRSIIEREDPETIAAFIAEPVMAGGGVLVPPAGYFSGIAQLLKEYDIACIADEVVCGFGRTGNRFGSETVGMRPDSMTVAKQLSSAYLPIAAVIIPDWMYEVLVDESRKRKVFGHGITYGGHPVPAAVALRSIELFDERNMLAHIREVAQPFQAGLRQFREHELVGDARGVGLIGALELVQNKRTKAPFDAGTAVGARCAAECLKEGLITRANGDALLFCPPQIITKAEIAEMFERLGRALDSTAVWVRQQGILLK